jgi:ribosomal-protein-alanine N-acetyltransferase
MTEQDIEQVGLIDRASFTLPWPDRSFKYEVSENENSIPLVAVTENGEVAGFIVVWVIVDEAHIGSIAVADAYRKLGIGEKIIREGLRMARDRGCLQAYLEVRRGNLAALHLYEKLGFGVDGIRPRYYEDNHEDAVLMSLKSLEHI